MCIDEALAYFIIEINFSSLIITSIRPDIGLVCYHSGGV